MAPEMQAPQSVPADYTMIRQPYRITMAKWEFTAVQKRILTMIISKLQKEISLLEKGMPVQQLSLFGSTTEDQRIAVKFQLNELVHDNNHVHVKKALKDLRRIDVEIVLPATVSKKSKKPHEVTILTGLIESAKMDKYSREVTVYMHRVTALELIEISNGLTVFAKDVMFLTNNIHTQKIYELLSHWKDKEVFSLTVEKFKEQLSIENKYPDITNLIRHVIKPSEKELKEIGDIYYEFSTTKIAGRITKFNFIIRHRKIIELDQEKVMVLKEEINNLLRRHFGFKQNHFEGIKELLNRTEILEQIIQKLIDLHSYIRAAQASPETQIKKVPEYVLKALLAEFSTGK